MKRFLMLLFPLTVFASNPDIDVCLKNWKHTPFGKNPNFRKLKASVKVIGIGSNVKDLEATEKPELVLVAPSVGVMSKQTYELMNPNGWYCIKGAVTVLGKSTIKAHCKAHIASSDDGVTIMGSNHDSNGVTVLGKVEIERVDCTEKKSETDTENN